ncbi:MULTISPECIES: terminase small subunit [Serratia]|uniref:Phage DNA packaging protein Nu1 n=1 Tax=Serratia quinivorans TaxID=137545 RepID=A0A379YFI1_9GAMM|nr:MULTISPECIES: terminase small subunit [Serratia]RYM56825.1 hypothetical protein BSR03_26485 [Serratia proteamaculans]CAI1718262.1 Phage DNA packaging protein Nu1 [Serratia quinivorans]SUI43947.1 Phage DNA packaging protein Nu1 [Serratia quinivorans]SUI81226.1 Phage DNA packaging protein Nu1 [Serratia quinivorans]
MATQAEVAVHLDLTDRQLRNLQKQPGAPVPKRKGDYDLDAWRVYYINYLRAVKSVQEETVDGKEANRDIQLQKAKIRLTEAQAYAQELKNLKDDQMVVDTAFCSFALSRLANDIAAILDGVPLAMQRRFTDMSEVQLDFLKIQIAKAMNTAVKTSEKIPEMLDEYLSSAD